MRNFILILALFLPSILHAGYYDLQHNKVVRDTTTILNDWEWRGNFSIGQDTYTVNLDNVQKGVILYGTGTVKSNDFRGDGSLLENISPDNISAGSLPSDVISSSIAINSVYQNALLPNTSNQPYVVWVTSAIYSLNAAGGVGGGGDTLPVGTIIPYVSTSNIPANYLYCNGSAVSRETYEALFNVIGIQFGNGDGSTTFNLPDFRGVVLRGLDNGKGLDFESDRVIGSYQQDYLKEHTHDLRFNNTGSGSTGDNDPYINSVQNYPTYQQTASSSVWSILGSTYAIENTMKNIAVSYLIKYQLSTGIEGVLSPDRTWKVIFSTTLATTQNSVTVTGLNGDYDTLYKISGKVKNTFAGSNLYSFQCNNDVTASYGWQYTRSYNGNNLEGAKGSSPNSILIGVSNNDTLDLVQFEGTLQCSSVTVAYTGTAQNGDFDANTTFDVYNIGGQFRNSESLFELDFVASNNGGYGAGSQITVMTLSTATIGIGIASAVASNEDAIIEADQDSDDDGLIKMRVKGQDILTMNTSRIDLNRDTYLLGESMSFTFDSISQDTTTLRVDVNDKIDKFRNVIFRPATSTTTVQQIIDSINDNCATCQYVIKLDYGCIDENLVVEPYVSLEGFGYNGTIISSVTVLFETSIAVPDVSNTLVLKNIAVENLLDVTLRNNYKTVSLLNCVVRATATFTGDNITEVFNFIDTTFLARPIFYDTSLASANSTEFSNGIEINSNVTAQFSGGEINGIVTLNDNSNLVVKNAAVEAITDSIFCEYVVNDNAILNIDPDTLAMAKITNNTGSNANIEVMGGISAGMISPEPIITKNENNTINISTGRCFIFDNSNQFGLPRRFNIPAVSSQTIVAKTNNYVLVNYNNGSPIYQISTTNSNNESDIILAYKVYLESNVTHNLSNDLSGEGLPNKILKRINNVEGFGRDYGIELGTGTANSVTVSNGVGWEGVSEISFNVFSSTSDDFEFYYTTSSGANWIRISTYTAYINDRYQTPTGLVNLLPGRYVCNYIYRGKETDPHVYFILGGQFTTAALAESESIPSSRPPVINEHAVYIGKLIVAQGNSAEQIVSGWGVTLTASSSFDHLSGINLNGGDGVGNHSNAANLQGRSGGQTLIGGTGAGDNLTLQSTSNASKGNVFISTWVAFDCVNQRLGIGTTSPIYQEHIVSSGTNAALVLERKEIAPIQNFVSATNLYAQFGAISNHPTRILSNAGEVARFNPDKSVQFLGSLFAINLTGSTGGSDLRFNTITGELFYDTSSEIYKENISTTTSTDWIYNATIKQYNRIGDSEPETGLIAEDLELLKPELVNYALFEKQGNGFILISKSYKNISDYYDISPNVEIEANLITYNDETESEVSEQKIIMKRPIGINYSAFIPAMLKELQLLKARVDALEGK